MAGTNRRNFLVAGTAAAAWTLVGPGLSPLLAASGRFRPLRRGAGVFTGRGGTIGWVAGRDASMVIDSQFPDTAGAFLDGFGRGGRPPLSFLANTHHHRDHTSGNRVFRPLVRHIVAQEQVPVLQLAASGAGSDRPVVADLTFAERWAADLGGERVEARRRGPAHTGGDASFHALEAGVVHVGDLVFNRLYPFIDVDGGASVRGWISSLEALAAEHGEDTLFVFGHGSERFGVTGNRRDLLIQRDLLAALLEHVERSVARGAGRKETTDLASLPGFPDHQAVGTFLTLGRCLEAVWREVTGQPGSSPE